MWVIFSLGAGILLFGLYPLIKKRSFTALRLPSPRREGSAILGLFIIAFFLGIFRFDAIENSRPDLSIWYGKKLALSGYISEDPRTTPLSQRLKVKVGAAEGKELAVPFFVLVTTRRYPRYRIGDEVELLGTLQKPENYNEFDYVSYLAREDIYATLHFPDIEKIGEWKGNRIKIILSRIKHAFEENLERVLPEPHGAFLKGLMLGERESIPPELAESFNRTGVTHIIALSGYNITLVSNFFIGTLLFFTIPFRVAFWIALLGVLFFVILTGASPSVVRAGVMGVLVLLAQKEGRMYRIMNALVFAGALMIFHNPKILRFDAAFQLSFLATLGLIFLSPPVDEKLKRAWHGLRRFLGLAEGSHIFEKDYSARFTLFSFRRVLAETLAAQLMVLPLIIYLFGRASLVSPLANLLVILAVPPSMAVGFFTGAIGFVWEPLAKISAIFNWVLLEYKIRVIEFLARVPWASVELGRWFALLLAAFYAILFTKLWLRSRKT